MTIVVVGTIRLPAANMPAARAAFAPLVADTLVEPGCITYAIAEDLAEPGLLRVSEVWADRAALDAHLKAPHLAQWQAGAGALGISEFKFKVFKVSAEESL